MDQPWSSPHHLKTSAILSRKHVRVAVVVRLAEFSDGGPEIGNRKSKWPIVCCYGGFSAEQIPARLAAKGIAAFPLLSPLGGANHPQIIPSGSLHLLFHFGFPVTSPRLTCFYITFVCIVDLFTRSEGFSLPSFTLPSLTILVLTSKNTEHLSDHPPTPNTFLSLVLILQSSHRRCQRIQVEGFCPNLVSDLAHWMSW